MAVTVRSLLNRAAAVLSDEEFVRWGESELLEWLNDGQRVVARGPATDAYIKRTDIQATAGTVQELPSDGVRLINVIQDVDTGSAVSQGEYNSINMLNRTWRAANTGVAEMYFYDDRNPKEFEVYPPQAGSETLQILYNAVPPNVSITGNIALDDMYADALLDYMLYRAFSKETEDSGAELQRATAHYRAFITSIGFKDPTDALVEPRRS